MKHAALPPTDAALGAAIRTRREALGLSQVTLARVIGVTNGYLSFLESGDRQPSLTTLRRLCYALGWRLLVAVDRR